jgi:hypothetical protein
MAKTMPNPAPGVTRACQPPRRCGRLQGMVSAPATPPKLDLDARFR